MTTLRLILGDQLNPLHSWFDETRPDVIYVLMEVRQETDYVLHHAQKILAIFAAMRDFARRLAEAGHRTHYLAIDEPTNRHSLPANLDALIDQHAATRLEYQAPDEYRLDRQLADYAGQLAIPAAMVDSEHFYTGRDDAAKLFENRKQWLMEHFYRHMRTRHDVLMAGGKPMGGQWNFDHDNRKPWPGLPREPADWRTRYDHSALWQSIVAAGVKSFGEPDADRLAWPLNREEALHHLDEFITEALPHFGDFQDALTYRAWRLFHSLLSFALNTKMLNPREVVARVAAAHAAGRVPLAAAEGFIRQILGWREYVRGVYWARMPGYAEHNFFEHHQPLPEWFWTGQTRMRCVAHAIGQSLDHAYAHHIQRLMVIGNFALLAGLDPAALHRWYLGIYIDAFEWVELPNTLGMSQFADGGLLATKPYASSAAYIDRMSDYCKGCAYDKKARVGDKACPFNALYWDFFDRNRTRLGANHRLSMVFKQLDRFDEGTLTDIRQHAESIRNRLNML
ncbi:cryptochrome/photolyase family protein [Zoogloea sp. LCSB751]|uniref:cryptochrome/photolyase family protein n=1 Tax=Zoogloea sp. LCSB751 TaxID=1965277 RepID=UPI0009A4A78F|nr:cryptochrome/photolyase family protein [Zoogloea sp. LCSB751]